MSARRDPLAPGQRVVLVDDWIETGSQAIATAQMIEECGARLVGIAVIVDEAGTAARAVLTPIRSLVRSSELGSPNARPPVGS